MMHKLLKKIDALSASNKNKEIRLLVEEQLKQNSNDIELWLGLAVAIINVPIVDYENSIACLERVLAIDANNVKAFLIIAHVYEYHLGGINDVLLHRIQNLDAGSDELNSLLKYVTSWSYSQNKKNDPKMEEKLLRESIKLCDKYVWNYRHLAMLYTREKRYVEVNELIHKAIQNIKLIYGKDIPYEAYNVSTTNVNEYINEYLKGIHTSLANVELLEEKLIPNHFSIGYWN